MAQSFQPYAWIGAAAYLLDVVVADEKARAVLDELCLLKEAKRLIGQRKEWAASVTEALEAAVAAMAADNNRREGDAT